MMLVLLPDWGSLEQVQIGTDMAKENEILPMNKPTLEKSSHV